ncbi:CLIP domain-containing serine protease 2 [Eumeta japonica]|uniref:CLIP domain-containing serine protease n=1 Tax=Eumeta variegata TaxID=151549 RepID=A0A4C1SS19_EUMVA|nr:CLIP domain-containing serine protease 2 [Eumeta japonica]
MLQEKICNGGAPCITLESCIGLYDLLQRGTNPQLTQLLRRLHCGFQATNQPKICCPPEYQTMPGGGNAQTTPSSKVSLLPNARECGVQQNDDRIVGGTQADLDDHPWMTLLRYDKPRGWTFSCGGVLITSRYVLTAAHCVKGLDLPSTWTLSQVRLGEWNTSSTMDCIQGDCNAPPLDVPIERIIPHEQYDARDEHQQNDIALLRLAREVQYTGTTLIHFIKPICLPLSDELRRSSFSGWDIQVAGWGKTETRSESDVKMKVRVPVVPIAECREVYQRVSRHISNKQLCAGGVEGQDSCRGDSGGALMGHASNSNNWITIGVVSYGPSPCGTKGWPGVYTRVGAYVDWILSKLEP